MRRSYGGGADGLLKERMNRWSQEEEKDDKRVCPAPQSAASPNWRPVNKPPAEAGVEEDPRTACMSTTTEPSKATSVLSCEASALPNSCKLGERQGKTNWARVRLRMGSYDLSPKSFHCACRVHLCPDLCGNLHHWSISIAVVLFPPSPPVERSSSQPCLCAP